MNFNGFGGYGLPYYPYYNMPNFNNNVPNQQQNINNNPNNNNYQQSQQQPSYAPQMNTNIIYVNGIDDVKNRLLPFNSNYIFLDNDKAIAYRKVVDNMGKMNVELYDLVPHKEDNVIKESNIDFVSRKEYEALKSDFEQLKNTFKQTTQQQDKKSVETVNLGSMGVNK